MYDEKKNPVKFNSNIRRVYISVGKKGIHFVTLPRIKKAALTGQQQIVVKSIFNIIFKYAFTSCETFFLDEL